jgi:hypothetical protein
MQGKRKEQRRNISSLLWISIRIILAETLAKETLATEAPPGMLRMPNFSHSLSTNKNLRKAAMPPSTMAKAHTGTTSSKQTFWTDSETKAAENYLSMMKICLRLTSKLL